MGCTPECWVAVRCTVCGDVKAPRGRSVPLGAHYCDHECPGYAIGLVPHLWSEHDSTRACSDPEGWTAHVMGCYWCAGEGGGEG